MTTYSRSLLNKMRLSCAEGTKTRQTRQSVRSQTWTFPSVFINGGEDIRPNWPTRQLASLMPRGRYVEIPGAAHCIWLTHSARLRHELRRAVRQLEQSNEPPSLKEVLSTNPVPFASGVRPDS